MNYFFHLKQWKVTCFPWGEVYTNSLKTIFIIIREVNSMNSQQKKKSLSFDCESFIIITSLLSLDYSRLWPGKFTAFFAGQKYTHPIKDKQEMECYLPWKSYFTLHILHLVHNDFFIFLQRKEIFDFKTVCWRGKQFVLNDIILN